MERSTLALIAIAVIGASAAVLAFTAADWATWVCYLPPSDSGKPLGPGPVACVEYWLNRYQALIGTLVAIAAATIAWIGINKTVAEMKVQTIAARREAAGVRRKQIGEIYDYLQEMHDLYEEIDRINHYQNSSRLLIAQRIGPIGTKWEPDSLAFKRELINDIEISIDAYKAATADFPKLHVEFLRIMVCIRNNFGYGNLSNELSVIEQIFNNREQFVLAADNLFEQINRFGTNPSETDLQRVNIAIRRLTRVASIDDPDTREAGFVLGKANRDIENSLVAVTKELLTKDDD